MTARRGYNLSNPACDKTVDAKKTRQTRICHQGLAEVRVPFLATLGVKGREFSHLDDLDAVSWQQ